LKKFEALNNAERRLRGFPHLGLNAGGRIQPSHWLAWRALQNARKIQFAAAEPYDRCSARRRFVRCGSPIHERLRQFGQVSFRWFLPGNSRARWCRVRPQSRQQEPLPFGQLQREVAARQCRTGKPIKMARIAATLAIADVGGRALVGKKSVSNPPILQRGLRGQGRELRIQDRLVS
jgi:hypothetical protein